MEDNKIVKKGGEDPKNVSPKEAFQNDPSLDVNNSSMPLGLKMFPKTRGTGGSSNGSGGNNSVTIDISNQYKSVFVPDYAGQSDPYVNFGENVDALNEVRDQGYSIHQDVIGTDYIQNLQADLQNDWRAVGNSLGRLVVGTASNLVSGTSGFVWELGEGLFTGTIDFNNWIYDTQRSIDEWSEDFMPVHRRTDALAFNPFDGEWWGNLIANFGPTMALMVAGMYTGGAAATGSIRLGSSLLEKASSTLKLAGQTKKALKLQQQAAKLASQGSKLNRRVGALAGSMTSRLMESGMEASHIYYDAFEEAIGSGMSVEDAKEKAGKAAQIGFWTNMPLMAMDYLQFNSIFKAIGPNRGWNQAAGSLVFNATSEGLEEGIQYGISKGALHSDSIMEGFANIVPEMAKGIEEGDRDFWDAVVQGAVGGGVFQALGSKTVNTYIDKAQAVFDSKKAEYLANEEEIRNKITNLSDKDAFTENDYEFAKRVFGASNRNLIPEIKEKLQELLSDEAKLEQLVGEQVDIGNGVMVSGKRFIEDRINLIDKIEAKRQQIQNKYGVEGIGNEILNDETLIMLGEQKLNIVKEQLDKLKQENDPVSLSDNGKRILNTKRQLRTIENTISALKEMTSNENGTSSGMEKQAVENQIKKLEERKADYSEIYKKLVKEIKEGMSPSELEELDMEIDYVEEVDPVIQPLEDYMSTLESQIDIYKKTRNLLSNPELSKKKRRERFIQNIKDSENSDVLSIFLNRNSRRLKDEKETGSTMASISKGIEVDDEIQKIIDNKKRSLENLDQKKIKTRKKLVIKYQEFETKVNELNKKKESLKDKDKSKLSEEEIQDLELKLSEIALEIENNKNKSAEYAKLVKELDIEGAFSAILEEEGDLTEDQQTEIQEAWEELKPIIEGFNDDLEKFNTENFETKIEDFYEFLNRFNGLYEQYAKEKFAMLTGMPDEYSQYDIDAMNYKLSKLGEVNEKINQFLRELSGFTGEGELEALYKASENVKGQLNNDDLTEQERHDLERKVQMYSQVQMGFQKTKSANDVYYNPYSGTVKWKGKHLYPAKGNLIDSTIFDESGEEILGVLFIDENFEVLNLIKEDAFDQFRSDDENVNNIIVNDSTLNEVYDLYTMNNIIETFENNQIFLKENFILQPTAIRRQLEAMSIIVEQNSENLGEILIHVRRNEEAESFLRLKNFIFESTEDYNAIVDELNKLLSPIKLNLAGIGIKPRTSREDILDIIENVNNNQKLATILKKENYNKIVTLSKKLKRQKNQI